MSTNQTCLECGTELPVNAPQGLCPRCLAGMGLKLIPSLDLADVQVERVGATIDRYKLLEQIGEGGFGVVFMAEQVEPVQRKVALKIIKAGMDTREVIARFKAERQVIALMDHPNIARALDAGPTETGRPYFVMELVNGIAITDYCDRNQLPIRERLRLFIKVCQAVQHAHQKGVIHRDLKPGNVLVTLHDGEGVPKVIDFGVAKALGQKLTGKTLFTGFHHLIGTPAYMSPEQAELNWLDVDTRSDIYSLGVLLYELLTGKTPFDSRELLAAGLDAMRETIREQEPQRPSTRLNNLQAEDLTRTAKHRKADPLRLISLLRADLDWIVIKCLEKDRTRRYGTANDLAFDIRRYLDNETVVARPPSNLYRFQKLIRRNKTVFVATAAVGIALLLGSIISTWQAVRATRAQLNEKTARLGADQARAGEAEQRAFAEENARKATESERRTQRLLYTADVTMAYKAWEEGNLSRVISLLGAHRPQPGEVDLRGFEYFYLQELAKGEQEQILGGHTNAVLSVAISPDEKWLASRGETDVRLWDFPHRTLTAVWPCSRARFASAARSQYGLSFSHDSRYVAVDGDGGLQVCDVLTHQSRTLPTGRTTKPVFSPVTNWVAFNSRATNSTWPREQVLVWDCSIDKPKGILEPAGLIQGWTPDGFQLLTGQSSSEVQWWDASALRCLRTNRFVQEVWSATISRDGRLTAVADWQGDVWLVERSGGNNLGNMPSGDSRPSALAFSPDSRFLATASRDQAILIWDIESRQRVGQLRGHQGKVTSLAYASDGRILISGGMDGNIMLWDLRRQLRGVQIPNRVSGFIMKEFSINPPRFSVDGRRVALAERDGRYSILDSSNFQLTASEEGDVAGFSPDSRQVAALLVASDQTLVLRVSAVSNLSERARVRLDADDLALRNPEVSPDGSFIALHAFRSAKSVLFDATTGESLISATSSGDASSQFSPDGRTWIYVDGPKIRFWDLRLRRNTRFLDCNSPVSRLALSRDGRFLAVSRFDLLISLWDLQSGVDLGTLSGHQAIVWALGFSADGRTLATGSEDRTVKLWDLATRRELASFPQDKAVYCLGFSPDNQMLVLGGLGSHQIWRAPLDDQLPTAGRHILSLPNLPTNSIWRLPDGARMWRNAIDESVGEPLK